MDHGEEPAQLIFSQPEPRSNGVKRPAAVDGAKRLHASIPGTRDGGVAAVGQGAKRQPAQQSAGDERQIASQNQVVLSPAFKQCRVYPTQRSAASNRVSNEGDV